MTDTNIEHRTPSGAEQPPAPPTGSEQRGAVARLALAIAVVVVLSVMGGAFKTVLVVVALLAMIMLHEFGHFVTAKWADMKVTEFFLGFGPRLWSVRKGETEYGIKAIPAGGYVKIIGMNNLERVDPADEPRTYRQKSYGRRMSVALAGSTMHFLIAFVLLWTLNGVVGLVNYDKPLPVVGELSKLETGQSPAVQAGFRVGDRVLEMDGERVTEWQQLPEYISTRPGETITFLVQRGSEQVTLRATAIDLSKIRLDGEDTPVVDHPRGFIGVGPDYAVEKSGPIGAIADSGHDLWDYGVGSLKALGSFFAPSNLKDYSQELTKGTPPRLSSNDNGDGGENRFLSPVGFVRVASQAADTGIRPVLLLLVLINIFVGIFNLVPLPPLDGGHVLIATYEKVRSLLSGGRRYQADVSKLMPVAVAVVMVFIAIGATSLWLDIVKPLSNPFQ